MKFSYFDDTKIYFLKTLIQQSGIQQYSFMSDIYIMAAYYAAISLSQLLASYSSISCSDAIAMLQIIMWYL